MLELKHIHKYYNPGTVHEMCLFEDFNLTIRKRRICIHCWPATVQEKPLF